jgi:lipopolysaccharide export system protein LptA
MIRALALGAAVLLMAPAAPPKPQPSSAPQPPLWDMRTTQMHANMATGEFSAPDHVLLTRADGSTVDADRATGNYKKHQASLYGNVIVKDAGGTFGLRSASAAQGRGPATLTSDELYLDDAAHTYDAKGNVHYVQGDTTVDAQTAHLNDVTHQIDLTGKVHVVQGDRTIDADRATYNTQSGLGEAHAAKDGDVIVTMPGPSPSIATPKPLKAPKIPIP